MRFQLAIIFCLVAGNLFSQNYYTRYREIISELDKKNIHSAIKLMDDFLQRYPNDISMYYNRGLAKYKLNQVNAARYDFKLAAGFGEQDSIIRTFIYKEYAANSVAKDYLNDTITLLEENNFKPVFNHADSLRGYLYPERTCFDVSFYDLKLRVIPKEKKIIGRNKIYFKAVENTKRIQVDLFSDYSIDSVIFKGNLLKYIRNANAIYIDFNEELKAGEKYNIQINYSGIPREAPNPPWNGGFVWKKKNGKDWIGVACEHLGASSWWPNKDHLSDKPDSMKISVEVPKELIAVCNGNLIGTYFPDNDYKGFTWFVSYPINNYNVTFYAGDFVPFGEIFTNSNGNYRIDYYVLQSNLNKAKKYYSQTKDIVEIYEKLFGEYPFKDDGIAMVEAPYRGMEHQSAIAIGDDYGKKNRESFYQTDYDYLVVHETAHEWWGNAVAVDDMADAWINEGFTTYTELLFLEEKFGYNKYIEGVADIMQYILNIWPMVGIRGVNDNTFLGGDIYNKGAIMLHNLRCSMDNDSLFKGLIKEFYNKSKFKINTTNDFLNFVADYTGKDYSPMLKTFLYNAEPPLLKYAIVPDSNDVILYYKFAYVFPGFEMPFNVLTNKTVNSCVKLMGNEKMQSVRIKNASFLYPPTGFVYRQNMEKNSFTYFLNDIIDVRTIKNEYNDSTSKEKGLIVDNLKEGEWKYYFPDGNLQHIINYKVGKKNGMSLTFNDTGERFLEKYYRNDTLAGDYIEYYNNVVCKKTFYKDGIPDTLFYYRNGKLESKGKIKDNTKNGQWQFYNTNGNISVLCEYNQDNVIPETLKYFDDEGNTVTVADTLTTVSVNPEYSRGLTKLYDDVNTMISLNNDHIPKENGTAYISFLVSPTGDLSEFKQENKYSPEFANAIINVLKNLPRWFPGFFNGKPVYTKVVYPFKYTVK